LSRDDKKRRSSRVPTSRIERLARISLMTGEFALGGIGEGVKRVLGSGTNDANLFLNPAGAERLARRLSRMRGAAMKIGQMISLMDEEILPKEFSDALAILRDSADTMPEAQVRQALAREFGKNWQDQFESFDFEPIAAASIGQVHTATTREGRELALKIQYPGVAESIDSDIDNLASALQAARLLPGDFDMAPMIAEAKIQLRQEADYQQEARYLERYRDFIGEDPRYQVPGLAPEFTSARILAMDRLLGLPLEDLAGPEYSQERRDEMGANLLELVFRELFEFGLMQTDPNFSNYLLLPEGHRLGLLDLGSAQEIPRGLATHYRSLFRSLGRGSRRDVRQAAMDIGFLEEQDSEGLCELMVDIFEVMFEPICKPGPYDFANANILSRAQQMGMDLALKHGYFRAPPAETMFLHRKLDGTILLCGKIKARVDVRSILDRVLDDGECN
jgi:predicted unusual protein kinase regulating ubiquinone biosynthesis (AarF/ABC1/UbiB family)